MDSRGAAPIEAGRKSRDRDRCAGRVHRAAMVRRSRQRSGHLRALVQRFRTAFGAGVHATSQPTSMTAIPKRILFSVAALATLLLALNLWLWPNQQLEQSPTSF